MQRHCAVDCQLQCCTTTCPIECVIRYRPRCCTSCVYTARKQLLSSSCAAPKAPPSTHCCTGCAHTRSGSSSCAAQASSAARRTPSGCPSEAARRAEALSLIADSRLQCTQHEYATIMVLVVDLLVICIIYSIQNSMVIIVSSLEVQRILQCIHQYGTGAAFISILVIRVALIG